MEYIDAFYNRGSKYDYAIDNYDYALKDEFETAIKVLNLQQNDTLLNIPSGGTPLYKYIQPSLNINYIPFEPLYDNIPFDNIPLNNNSVDKIVSLAAFHHVQENRMQVLREFTRLLKPNGVLVIGDVIDGSKQAYWLNDFVDRYNSNGHKGMFLTKEDASVIKNMGYDVQTSIHTYKWSFKNDDDAYDCLKNLFGLDLIYEKAFLLDALRNILDYKDCSFEWQLMYFRCIKK